MSAGALNRRFFDTTRGRILTLLRRDAQTVEELAHAVGLTGNAVRNHLAALERDGLVRQEGVTRSGSAGKPAARYALSPEAALLLSRAYPPVLSTVLDVVVDELPADRTGDLLREVGRRLARRVGGRATGDVRMRIHAAAGVLEALGGDVEVIEAGGVMRIVGSGCPLSSVVCHRPEVCHAVEAMLTEVADTPARTRCEHGERPRCCFEFTPES